MVGQEMASSYGLYEMKMSDLQSSIECEHTMAVYSDIINQEESVVKYVTLYHKVFGLEYEESKVKYQ